MKSISAGLTTHIQGEVTTLATCWKLKRTDNVIIAATSLDRDVPFDLSDGDGPLTYKSATGYDRTALSSTADFKVDNMEVHGLVAAAGITKEDVRAELYDYAEVKIFQVNYRDLTQNEAKMTRGFLGQVSLRDGIFQAELRGLIQLYSTEIGDIVTPECIVDLFDGKCKVQELPASWAHSTAYLATDPNDANVGSYVRPSLFNDRYFKCTVAGTSGPASYLELEGSADHLLLEDGPGALVLEGQAGGEPTWNLTLGGTTADGVGALVWTAVRANLVPATVVAVTDRRVFDITTSPATDAPDIFFREGTVQFTRGLNSSLALKREIKDWDLAAGRLTLWRPMPFDVAAGDLLDVSSGCNKTTGVCSATYGNIFNHRGWPHAPGENKMVEAPRASA